MTDDLTEQLAEALREAFPNLEGTLRRGESHSAIGTPLFYLFWTDEPSMADVRDWLDRSQFARVSVIFGKEAGGS